MPLDAEPDRRPDDDGTHNRAVDWRSRQIITLDGVHAQRREGEVVEMLDGRKADSLAAQSPTHSPLTTPTSPTPSQDQPTRESALGRRHNGDNNGEHAVHRDAGEHRGRLLPGYPFRHRSPWLMSAGYDERIHRQLEEISSWTARPVDTGLVHVSSSALPSNNQPLGGFHLIPSPNSPHWSPHCPTWTCPEAGSSLLPLQPNTSPTTHTLASSTLDYGRHNPENAGGAPDISILYWELGEDTLRACLG